MRCPSLLGETKVATILGIGPSRVLAPLLAAGRNEGGHYFRYFLSYLTLRLLVCVFENFEGYSADMCTEKFTLAAK
jgi:hypothetical protein